MIDRGNSPWRPAEHPDLGWRDGVPHARAFDDIYYSTTDGLGESRHVFLQGSNIQDQLGSDSLVVAETGFGTGLNFLLLLQAWCETAPGRSPHAHLHYIGLEAQPLKVEQLRQAQGKWTELAPFADRLRADWPGAVPGCHRLQWRDWGVTLDLWWEDALGALQDLASRNRRYVNVWFLDGFAPARNSGLWSQALFDTMAELSQPDAHIATFTAAGDVRRGLEKAGFQVQKRPGFGSKRESLQGQYVQGAVRPKKWRSTPWDLAPSLNPPATGLVLGAGLAGCFVARALADRGIAVTVLDSATVASGGSSNLQGMTYTRPSRRHSPLTDFSLASYLHACRLYSRLLGRELKTGRDGELSGYLQITDDARTLDYLAQFTDTNLPFRVLSAEAASAALGAHLVSQAYFFPQAAWLNPRAVCEERLRHPLIEVHENLDNCRIKQQPGAWQVRTASGANHQADVLIACAGHTLSQFPETNWLPLQAIRGQTTHVKATPTSSALRTAFCHDGYFPPPRLGIHCMGASYGPNDESLEERVLEHTQNLDKLAALLPDLNLATHTGGLVGHVALRCTTTDYLPVAGPVPDKQLFNRHFSKWRTRKTQFIDHPCPVLPGLYVLSGLGSRGLTAAPLAAEVIVSELLQEPSPVPRYLQQALAPARFLKRAIVKGNPL